MDTNEPDVYCGECGTNLDEAATITPDEREPCPSCGSTRRNFAITIGGAVELDTALSVTPILPPATVVQHSTDALLVAGDARIAVVQELARSIRWYEPTEGSSVWMAEVYDDAGEVLASGMGDDPEDALLELADHLMPPKAEDPSP